MCCPLSNERVCAIKAKPPVVVNAIKLIQNILIENPLKGTVKPYDALHFDLNLIDKYGGYLPDELLGSHQQPAEHQLKQFRPHSLGQHQHQQHFAAASRHQMQADVAAIAAAAAAAATAGYSSSESTSAMIIKAKEQ